MKKIYMILATVFILLVISACNKNVQTVKIAVIGNEDEFYPGYLDGIKGAAEQARADYANSGMNIEYEFYGYDGTYSDGAAIVDMLAADESVTAVIGAVDMDLNKTAAYIFNDAKKVFVVPFFLYDSVYENNHYSSVFSMCNSGESTGALLRRAAGTTNAKRWVVCSADGEFETEEMNGFLQVSKNDGIDAVDCVSIAELEKRFDEIYSRWDTLGVEGVVIFAEDNEGFDILKKIKRKSPDIICAGDTAFDDTDVLDADPELKAAMEGFLIANEFVLNLDNKENAKKYIELADKYSEEMGKELDSWYVQGIDAVKMITDTALYMGTANPEKIAAELHENGYSGLFRDMTFDEYGCLNEIDKVYNIFGADGYTKEYMIEE